MDKGGAKAEREYPSPTRGIVMVKCINKDKELVLPAMCSGYT